MAEKQLQSATESPRIATRDDGRIELAGDLTFDTVGALFARNMDAFSNGRKIVVDLAGIARADSAGLALLVEWLRQARRSQARLEVINMPEQMHSIASMCKLDGVLSPA